MKKIITRSLVIIFSIGMLITGLLNIFLQMHLDKKEFQRITEEHFWQIEHILEENKEDISSVEKEFAQNCIAHARAAAYISRHFPEMIESREECIKVAELLQIDELHFFTPEGVIYAGTHPEYYGYSFSSGEQMAFFAPMLGDYSMELCQDIEPNTAENKLMQYSAVWSRDHKRIVQIGMKPERVLKEKEKNSISKIFPKITSDRASQFYAVDTETLEILGSTEDRFVGKNIGDYDFEATDIPGDVSWKMKEINGKRQYCAIKNMGDILLIKIIRVTRLYEDIFVNTLLLCGYCFLLFVVIILATYIFLDRKIIRSIVNINKGLKEIEKGKWDTVLFEDSTKEFAELSAYINSMVGSLLNFSNKMSKALELSGIPIGICEYIPGGKRFTASSRVKDILMMSDEEFNKLLDDSKLFEQKLEELCSEEARIEEKIYRLNGSEERDIYVEAFDYQRSKIMILMDVTTGIQEKLLMAEERDTDLLTGLYNRRAFYRAMDTLFAKPKELKTAFLMAVDLDKLKMVNDVYGHGSGDQYLKAFSEILNSCKRDGMVAARMGGDEFILFVSGLKGEEEVKHIIGELLAYRGTYMVPMENGEEISLEFSVGWTICTGKEKDYQALMDLADKRMYEEKKRRKGLK